MKIGINASFLRKPYSGIGQVTLNFLKRLAQEEAKNKQGKNKHEFILYLEEDLPKDFDLPKNFQKRIFLPLYRRDDLIRKIWWEKYLLPRKIKKDSCDLFFSLYQCPTILKNGPKHFMLVHDIIPSLFPEYLIDSRKRSYQRLTEIAIKKADKILAVSNRTEKDLIQNLGVPAEKISLNYISIDENYQKKVSAEKSKKALKKYKLNPGYIFAGGGMEIRKNIEGVIRAYKLLLEKNKTDFFIEKMPRLVIYGKELPNLPLATDARKIIKELKLTKYVKLLGAVPQANLPSLFKNALFFIYPSHYEGFGMQILESMSQGTPTICAKNSSLPEVGMDSVLYCHSHDTQEIAQVMKKVLTSDALRKILSERGYARSKLFSWEKFTKKFYHVIENNL